MSKWLIGLVLSLLWSFSAPPAAIAQDGVSRKKQEKLLEKKAKQEKKEKAKQERFDRRRHLSVQDKATRKRMRRNTKRADRHGSDAHRDGFFRRTFGW